MASQTPTILYYPDNDKCQKQKEVCDAIRDGLAQIQYLKEHTSLNIPHKLRAANVKRITKLQNERKKQITKLIALKNERRSQKRNREKKREFLLLAKEKLADDPDVAQYNIKDEAGRPRYVDTYEGREYLSVLEALVDAHCASDARRRSEERLLLAKGTDIHRAMKQRGFEISQSATYLYFAPRNAATAQGKRHYNSLNVKLRRAQHEERKTHAAHNHCQVLRHDQFTIAAIMGDALCNVICTDDKAKVPLGIAAAHKEQKILMKLERRVKLPDHSYSVGAKHKLIPSVIVRCDVVESRDKSQIGHYTDVKSYGKCFVAVRSNYHVCVSYTKSTTSVQTHRNDFERMVNDDNNAFNMCDSNGAMKPILLESHDGGTDLQIRNTKQIKNKMDLFKAHDLDYLFDSQSAPDMSFINKCERYMAFLTQPLSGLILEHEHFGSHLKNRVVVDEDLCKQNLYRAGDILASRVWNGMEVKGHPVVSKFVPREMDEKQSMHDDDLILSRDDMDFFDKHCVVSRHSLQISKCFDDECDHCSSHPVRSNIFKLLKARFVPPPYAMERANGILKMVKPDRCKNAYFPNLMFRLAFRITVENCHMDSYNDELNDKELKQLICNGCNTQFGSQKLMKLHKKYAHEGVRGVASNINTAIDEHIDTDIDVKGLLDVIDERNGEFMCTFNDDHVEWMELNPDHPAVVDFRRYKANSNESEYKDVEAVTNYGDWIRSEYILEE